MSRTPMGTTFTVNISTRRSTLQFTIRNVRSWEQMLTATLLTRVLTGSSKLELLTDVHKKFSTNRVPDWRTKLVEQIGTKLVGRLATSTKNLFEETVEINRTTKTTRITRTTRMISTRKLKGRRLLKLKTGLFDLKIWAQKVSGQDDCCERLGYFRSKILSKIYGPKKILRNDNDKKIQTANLGDRRKISNAMTIVWWSYDDLHNSLVY